MMNQTEKKIAILLLCHTLPRQINDFIGKLDQECFDFFVHVDRKSDILPQIYPKDNVHFVPENKRIDVRWGTYSMVEAILALIDLALSARKYDYFWLCSGQDFPIVSAAEIRDFFKDKQCNFISFSSSRNYPINGYRNPQADKRCEIVYPPWLIGRAFWQKALKKLYQLATGGTGYTWKLLRRTPPNGFRLYFGSQWWCLNRATVEWLYGYIRGHDGSCRFFRYTACPDESFFHTLVMNSPYAAHSEPELVYIDWTEEKGSPKVLTSSDWGKMMASGKLLARKIDAEREPELYRKLLRV